MNEKKYNQKSTNQKFIYETLKQDIISLSNIKSKFNEIIKKNNLINPQIFLNSEKKNQKQENNSQSLALNIKYIKNKSSSWLNLEKRIYKRFYQFYQTNKDFYNIKIINEIISNENSHIVAEFKDFLIKDDYSEFIQKFYKKKEILTSLKKIFEYYKLSSVVYPNYILLPENKYIYRNIQKKQKIIDDQQEQEERNNDEDFKIRNLTDRNNPLNNSEKVFDSKIIDSILNQTNTSQIKKFVFGVSNESSIDLEDNNLFDLVQSIKKAEENVYSIFIEKNKLVDNKIKNNNKDDKDNTKIIKEKQNILNTCFVKNVHRIKQFINNNNSNNKICSRNEQNCIDFPEFGKTYSDFSSNLINIKNINNKGENNYNLFINKDKDNKIHVNNDKNKTPLNNNKKHIIIKDKNLILEKENIKRNEILVNKKIKNKKKGRNNTKDLFDSISKNEINSLNKIFKSDWNININNSINIKTNSISKNPILMSSKEKNNQKDNNTKKKLFFIQNLELSKKQDNENNKLIKKSVIKELLSLVSSNKETLKYSKLPESQRQFSHSFNKTERKKKLNNDVNNQNNIKNNKNTADFTTDINYKNNILRTKNRIKKNKEISLDIINNNDGKIFYKNSYNKISAPFNNNFKIDNTLENNLDINSYNERNTIIVNKEKGNHKNITGKMTNLNSKNESKYNSINSKNKLIKNKNKQLNLNNVLNNVKHAYEKGSRNKSNFYYQNSTYAMLNMKKLLNINNSIHKNTINSTDKNHSNITIPHKTISSNLIPLKDNLKLYLDYLKTGNLSKKVESNRDSSSANKNSKDINNINNNSNLIKIKKQNELFPLSAREYEENNDFNIKNYNRVLKKSNKHKTLKNSFNETGINNIISGYSNSYKNKNKYIKKTQNTKLNNQNLLLSNCINKNPEEKFFIKKQKNNIISETSSQQKNKKNIHNQISHSSNNNSELNSMLITNFNSSLNNYSISKNKSRNTNDNICLKELKTVSNINDEKKNSNNNIIHTPNIYNSNKKSIKREKFLIYNKSINDKNTRYYNIEVNIHNDINNKTINNKEKISISKINPNFSKQHIKLNSTQFSTGSLNINFNNYTNNYCINYNNNNSINTIQNKTKYTQIQSKNYRYKRIKNMKNNLKEGFQIKKIDKLILKKNKNDNFFPLAYTDRNKKNNLFSPINSYSINIPNKK